MKCEKCNSEMVVEYAQYQLTSNPPFTPRWWYCGCGHKVDIPREKVTMPLTTHEQWLKMNQTSEGETK